jgi:hypothetical protein
MTSAQAPYFVELGRQGWRVGRFLLGDFHGIAKGVDELLVGIGGHCVDDSPDVGLGLFGVDFRRRGHQSLTDVIIV